MHMPHSLIARWAPRALGMAAIPGLALAALFTTSPTDTGSVLSTESATEVTAAPAAPDPGVGALPAEVQAQIVASREAATTTTAPVTTTTAALAAEAVQSSEMAPAPTPAPPQATSPAPVISNPAPTTAPEVVPVAPTAPTAPPETSPAPPASKNCVVRLHGKGGSAGGTSESNGVTELRPGGNGTGWGGRQWSYASSGEYSAARSVVANAIDGAGCTRVVLIGFSNGASMAAKLYCRGENFGGRLARVIVDDPVTDHAVNGCSPAGGVGVALYWTGALQGVAQPGWACSNEDWTCEGGSTLGISAYAGALGTGAKASPQGGHSAYTNPPELHQF